MPKVIIYYSSENFKYMHTTQTNHGENPSFQFRRYIFVRQHWSMYGTGHKIISLSDTDTQKLLQNSSKTQLIWN